jgi:hypothetical protein
MRKLVPLNDSAVCKKTSGGDHKEESGGILVKRESVDIYEIVSLPKTLPEGFFFKVGDKVMSNSTGDEIEVNPNETVYLFKLSNLMCTVEI